MECPCQINQFAMFIDMEVKLICNSIEFDYTDNHLLLWTYQGKIY